MSDYLVEIQFDGSSLYSKDNILTKKDIEKLQVICSRPLEYNQLSKKHIEKQDTYLWKDEDKEHPDTKILVDAYDISGKRNIVPLKKLLLLEMPNVKYHIVCKIKEVPEYGLEENLLHKLIKFEERLNVFDKLSEFNFKVGVHISDLGLLNVRQVTWLEDACTKTLQDELDRGWRILAICPQPNSRRPDYILGRNDRIDE